jgi:predicted MFS family arabinose efflux permease
MLTEVTPPEVRGIYLGLITVTFNIGQLFGLLVGSFTIPTLESGNWRLLIVICGLPGLLAWCLSYWMLDDTVRFTLLDQQFDLSFQIIDKMILMNRPA